MKQKTVYQLDPDGKYIGAALADESPLEPGVFLIPAGCVTVQPPIAKPGFDLYCVNGVWKYVKAAVTQPTDESPTDSYEILRLRAYSDPINGSDRLFVEASRMQMMGEDGWESVRDQGIARYNEIRAQYPNTSE